MPRRSSGARYHSVTTVPSWASGCSGLQKLRAMPKSAILTRSPAESSTLAGLRSRCITCSTDGGQGGVEGEGGFGVKRAARHPVRMEEGDALDELARNEAERVGRERSALLVLQLDALRQVAALHVLEHQVERPTAALRRLRVQEGADQPHHAGVRQPAQNVHLAVGMHLNAALRPKLARALDRDLRSSACVHRSKHFTKRAVAELALRSEVLEGGQFGRCCGGQRRLHRGHGLRRALAIGAATRREGVISVTRALSENSGTSTFPFVFLEVCVWAKLSKLEDGGLERGAGRPLLWRRGAH